MKQLSCFCIYGLKVLTVEELFAAVGLTTPYSKRLQDTAVVMNEITNTLCPQYATDPISNISKTAK